MSTDGKTRIRTRKDPAYLLRSWAWYWNLKQVSGGLSDYALDLKMLQPGGKRPSDMDSSARPRMFERIRKSGSDPNHKHSKRGFSLLERVEKHYPGTSAIYQSPLWRLIRPPIPTNNELSVILAEQMSSFGLGRLDTYAYTMLMTEEEPDPDAEQLPLWPNPRFFSPLKVLSRTGSIEALSLLTALVLECRDQDLFGLKLELIGYALHCLAVYAESEQVKPFRDMLWFVYNERIILNNWALVGDGSRGERPIQKLPLDSLLPIIALSETKRLTEIAVRDFLSRKNQNERGADVQSHGSIVTPSQYTETNPPPWDPKSSLQKF